MALPPALSTLLQRLLSKRIAALRSDSGAIKQHLRLDATLLWRPCVSRMLQLGQGM